MVPLRHIFVIYAGPNGAGKSTLIDELKKTPWGQTLCHLNADERTKEIRAQNPDLPLADANLQAAQDIDQNVTDLIKGDQNLLVETVLSSSKYRQNVLQAKDRDFVFALGYVSNASPDISIARVKFRAAHGGHDVPEDKIRSRWERSHEQLAWFAKQADMLQIHDNSSTDSPLKLVFTRDADGNYKQHAPAPNTHIQGIIDYFAFEGPRQPQNDTPAFQAAA